MYKGKRKIKKISLQDMKLTQKLDAKICLNNQPLIAGQLWWWGVQLEGMEVTR